VVPPAYTGAEHFTRVPLSGKTIDRDPVLGFPVRARPGGDIAAPIIALTAATARSPRLRGDAERERERGGGGEGEGESGGFGSKGKI